MERIECDPERVFYEKNYSDLIYREQTTFEGDPNFRSHQHKHFYT